MITEFDHLVVTAPDIESGLAHVQDRIGLRVPPGGQHPLMGTHNHLVRLGDAAFLEVIAPDPTARTPDRPRWYALDHVTRPSLSHWVVRTGDMAALHPRLPKDCGPAIPVTRGALNWLLTVPEDGSLPMQGCFPSVIEWQAEPLPPTVMPDMGLQLEELILRHPDPDLAKAIGAVIDDRRIVFEHGEFAALGAAIVTPGGVKWLD